MRVKRKTKKPLVIASIVVASGLVAGLLWYYAFSSPGNDNTSEPSASEEKSAANKRSDEQQVSLKDSSDDKDEPQSVPHESEKDLPQLYEGDNVNNSGGLTGIITAKSVMGDSLVIRNTIDQLVGSGSCTLTLFSSAKTVTKTAEIAQNPSSSTCAGFDVPIAELGRGSWNIEIKVSSGDKGMTLKETVNI